MAENNTEVTKVAINDIGTEEDFIKAVDSTIKNFDDGDLVEGTIVKIDHDEVLLDIGYKTEGVIPSRELSIKKDVDPDEVVEVGDTIEALVVTKEDKEGRLSLSKKRAQYERAWGDIEKIKEADGVVERAPSSKPSRAASSSTSVCVASCPRPSSKCVAFATSPRTSARRSRPRSWSSTRTATTWFCPAASTWRRLSPKCARPSCPSSRRARSARVSCPPSSTSARSSIWAVSTA